MSQISPDISLSLNITIRSLVTCTSNNWLPDNIPNVPNLATLYLSANVGDRVHGQGPPGPFHIHVEFKARRVEGENYYQYTPTLMIGTDMLAEKPALDFVAAHAGHFDERNAIFLLWLDLNTLLEEGVLEESTKVWVAFRFGFGYL